MSRVDDITNKLPNIRKSREGEIRLVWYFMGIVVGFCVGYNVHKEFGGREREQRIVEFYQKNGPLTQNATPTYLDLRTQLWVREVEEGGRR